MVGASLRPNDTLCRPFAGRERSGTRKLDTTVRARLKGKALACLEEEAPCVGGKTGS